MPSHFLFTLAALFSILTLTIQRKHLLMSLLCLEMMILMILALLVFNCGATPIMNTFLFIVLLTFGACEASLGLALLVIMMRSFGSDLVNLLTISKC